MIAKGRYLGISTGKKDITILHVIVNTCVSAQLSRHSLLFHSTFLTFAMENNGTTAYAV
jgi:hypothetical protein